MFLKQTDGRSQAGRMVFAMVFILALTLGFVIFTLLPNLPKRAIPIQEDGVIDLVGGGFGSVIEKLPYDGREYLTGTYRAVLKVIPGEIYAMSICSPDYAAHVYVDGEEVMPNYIFPVASRTETVEIMIEYANFSQYGGGTMRKIIFGSFGNVNSYAQASMNSSSMLGGALLLVAVFYFMLFLGGNGFPNFAFSLCCFLLATRNRQFVISLLPFDYDWSFVCRFAYINNICTGMAFLLFVYSMYPDILPRYVVRVTVVRTVATITGMMVIAMFAPLNIVAWLGIPSCIIFIPAVICICWILGKVFMKGRGIDRIMACSIAALCLILTAGTILRRAAVPEITLNSLGAFGMFAFAICQMLALGMENAQLSRLNRMKTELLQNVSHEMRTPLTIIASGVDYADEQIDQMDKTGYISGVPEIRGTLDIVREAAQRAGRMAQGMVKTIRMNEDVRQRKRTDFAILLMNSGEASRIAFEKQNNTLHVNIAPGLPDVFAETDKFSQVMANLLSNAADHTKNGRVYISANSMGPYIIVRIIDTGEGIPPNLLPHVFERGISGSGSTGYGLYLCKTIIESHGGAIRIESKQGKGTTVLFTVPVYAGQEAG